MKTASFFTYTGDGRVSIARRPPVHTPPGFSIYTPLQPGPYFNRVGEGEYRRRYFKQLAALDAQRVVDDLHQLTDGVEVVLLCWENPREIEAGLTFCHRHMVAQWLQSELGIVVAELPR